MIRPLSTFVAHQEFWNHPQASEDAQLVPSCSPAVRFSGSSKVTQGVSPQVRARGERAQLQRRREETRPV